MPTPTIALLLKGLTLSNPELARMAGVSVYAVRDWKIGRRQPTRAARRRLAAGLRRYLVRVERAIAALTAEA